MTLHALFIVWGLVNHINVYIIFHQQLRTDVPVTFTSVESFIKVSGMTSSGGTVRASFQFRTHDEDGLMLYHKLDKNGEIEVC